MPLLSQTLNSFEKRPMTYAFCWSSDRTICDARGFWLVIAIFVPELLTNWHIPSLSYLAMKMPPDAGFFGLEGGNARTFSLNVSRPETLCPGIYSPVR